MPHDIIRYYRPFRKVAEATDAIPMHEVRYLSITNPFATNYTLDYSIV